MGTTWCVIFGETIERVCDKLLSKKGSLPPKYWSPKYHSYHGFDKEVFVGLKWAVCISACVELVCGPLGLAISIHEP
jgi:hypothetical protein